MIDRKREIEILSGLIGRHKVLGIIGARQVGKTTLARALLEKINMPFSYFDLENPEDLTRLTEPMLALKELKGLVVIDEVQRYPGIFQVLRVLVDRPDSTTRFLVLGSASPELLQQSSETLAGRIFYHELGGFAIDEIGLRNHKRLWFRGGFPRSYTARSHAASHEWRLGFVRTFLERDLPALGIKVLPSTLRRFWTMLAHYHGQIWNASEFARSFGVTESTVRHYLDLLSSAMIVRKLQPWFENIKKRQVKAPKIYLIDSGLVHTLLNLRTPTDLEGHPKIGASWEGFVIEQLTRHLQADREECFFWRTHAGTELDLLVVRGQKRFGFEVKRSSAPKLTPSMRNALADLKLNRLDVIHAGAHSFPMHEKIRAVAFTRMFEDVEPLQ